MMFRVRTLRKAENDFRQILSHIAARSKSGAVAWAKAFRNAMIRLESEADHLPLAAENDHVEFEVREVLFKTRRGLVYRALFTIRANDVFVLHVRGPGQDFLTAEQLHGVD
jgi:plasmid stabilization system protein ParE